MSTNSVGVLVLSEDQKRILLQKREDLRVWSIPAGRMENGESQIETGIRETQEETGYIVEIGQLIGEYHRPQLPHGGDALYVYEGRVVGGDPEGRGWESVAVAWFPVEQLPRKTVRFTREYLADLQNGKLPVKKEQLLPWWYIILLRFGFFLRNIRNRIIGRP